MSKSRNNRLNGTPSVHLQRKHGYLNEKARILVLPGQPDCARLHTRCAHAYLGVPLVFCSAMLGCCMFGLMWTCVRAFNAELEHICCCRPRCLGIHEEGGERCRGGTSPEDDDTLPDQSCSRGPGTEFSRTTLDHRMICDQSQNPSSIIGRLY